MDHTFRARSLRADHRRRAGVVVASAVTGAALAAATGSATASTPPGSAAGSAAPVDCGTSDDVTLTVGLFGAFGFKENGLYNATLKVTDSRGRSAATSVRIVIGNAPPVVELVRPATGDPFAFGDLVQFEVRVTDDQPVDCSRVTVDYILGHDEHGHGQSTARGCTGSIQTTVPSGHDPGTDDLTGVFVAGYTDSGEGDLPPLTGTARVVLDPTP